MTDRFLRGCFLCRPFFGSALVAIGSDIVGGDRLRWGEISGGRLVGGRWVGGRWFFTNEISEQECRWVVHLATLGVFGGRRNGISSLPLESMSARHRVVVVVELVVVRWCGRGFRENSSMGFC